jgi:hypothetical protein
LALSLRPLFGPNMRNLRQSDAKCLPKWSPKAILGPIFVLLFCKCDFSEHNSFYRCKRVGGQLWTRREIKKKGLKRFCKTNTPPGRPKKGLRSIFDENMPKRVQNEATKVTSKVHFSAPKPGPQKKIRHNGSEAHFGARFGTHFGAFWQHFLIF